MIWKIEKITRTGKPKIVATIQGAYELGTYRLSLVVGENKIEYADRPNTYNGCVNRLEELTNQTIAELRAKKV